MISQLAVIEKITPHLYVAIFCFAGSVIVNSFFFVLETAPRALKFKGRFLVGLVLVLMALAIGLPISGIAAVLMKFSVIGGFLFGTVATSLSIFLLFAISGRGRPRMERAIQEFHDKHSQAEKAASVVEKILCEAANQTDPLLKQEIAARAELALADVKRYQEESGAILRRNDQLLDRVTEEMLVVFPRSLHPTPDDHDADGHEHVEIAPPRHTR